MYWTGEMRCLIWSATTRGELGSDCVNRGMG